MTTLAGVALVLLGFITGRVRYHDRRTMENAPDHRLTAFHLMRDGVHYAETITQARLANFPCRRFLTVARLGSGLRVSIHAVGTALRSTGDLGRSQHRAVIRFQASG